MRVPSLLVKNSCRVANCEESNPSTSVSWYKTGSFWGKEGERKIDISEKETERGNEERRTYE